MKEALPEKNVSPIDFADRIGVTLYGSRGQILDIISSLPEDKLNMFYVLNEQGTYDRLRKSDLTKNN